MTHLFAAAQWPTLLALLIGYLAPHVATLLHRHDAPDWLIAGTAHILASAAVAVTTVIVKPGDDWKIVAGNVGLAIAASVAGHKSTGVTANAKHRQAR